MLSHLIAVTLLQSTQTAVLFILPVIAKKQFGAGNWQVFLITAPPTILFITSIFWNDLFGRLRFSRFMALYWIVACLPLALVAFAQSYWMLLVPHLVSCAALSAYHPAAGGLLKRLYPDSARGRVYGLLWGGSMVAGAFTSWGVGHLLETDPESFRWYMPLAAGLQMLGVIALAWLSHATRDDVRSAPALATPESRGALARVVDPVVHMRTVLREDPTFARYEGAYMTYGVGWMIAYALLPILATTKLGLNYEQFMNATQVPYLLAIVAMIYPAGLLLDKLGAVRTTALSFAALSLYPLMLIGAGSAFGPVTDLTTASLVYGIAHSGASIGWMLGPVALAPRPEKVPQYVAIHATLVGLRGAVFQFAGVGLYELTGSFTWPLLAAAIAYLWSAQQMWSLHRRIRAAAPAPVVHEPQDRAEPAGK
ncbi:MAG: MFS transporter [Planctomycetota bacterium]|nr:MFS transporter [Planctomycetota bacterium]